jgi:centrosomal protein CEP104
VNCSSEDPGYPADELNVHSPNTRGWQSVKFSEYPQEIGLAIDGGDAQLSQIQILSHQCKIASKVEIYVGKGSSYQSAEFKRLGYLSLDSNERSQYQARELKTVYIDYAGQYIRLIIHRNYVNKQNLFNQVGLVAVSLLGVVGPGGKGIGGLDIPNAIVGGNNPLNDLSVDMNLDPQTAAKLRLLSETKARAIATEDYMTAKQIKAVEGELKALGSRLAQLDMAKRQAVGAEDYDRAKDIKDETDELRGDIERKILEIHIPGVTDAYQGFRGGGPQHALPGGDFPAQSSPERSQKPKFAPSSEDSKASNDNPFESVDGTSTYDAVHRSDADSKSGAIDIDDLPVSGTGEPGKKRSSESDPVEYRDRGIASAPEEYLPNGDRPIRPKSRTDYEDADPDAGIIDVPERFKEENFSPGAHPLEGMPNFEELPIPEELRGKSRDVSDQNGVTTLVGDYLARCLFSRNWQLRETAINKIDQLLKSEYENTPGITQSIQALATIVRLGVEDKIQQVLYASVTLLDDILSATRRAKMGRSVIAPVLDPVTANLVEKLSDGNARIREGARKGTEILASSANIGPAVVGAHALRALNAKQKSGWRPILARLQLLTDLINQYGLGNNSGIMAQNVMVFAQNNNCFAHSNGEVRDAAKDLTVAVQKLTGTDSVEGYLKGLRPKQLEEYESAFGGGSKSNTGGTSSVTTTSAAAASSSSVPQPTRKNKSDTPTSPIKSKAVAAQEKGQDDEEGLDYTTCMFCGASDSTWDEDALDLHYWKDCPLLSPCEACAQVVEIAGMADHLLEECEHKGEFRSCETTGLAVRISTYSDWKNSPQCIKCPPERMYCPLCLTTVADTDDAWKQHLFYDCAKNTRSRRN